MYTDSDRPLPMHAVYESPCMNEIKLLYIYMQGRSKLEPTRLFERERFYKCTNSPDWLIIYTSSNHVDQLQDPMSPCRVSHADLSLGFMSCFGLLTNAFEDVPRHAWRHSLHELEHALGL
jgi:hypothetical protein